MKNTLGFLQLVAILGSAFSAGPKFAPYYDTFLRDRTNLTDFAAASGQKHFHLAFALGSGWEGCTPTWGAEFALDDPTILGPIKTVQASGGEMIIAAGGALGPYLEHVCTNVQDLTAAYLKVLDVVGTNHLDLDVETGIDFNLMNSALAEIQRQRPDVTISYTLMVQAEDYGITPGLGVEVLKNAKSQGVKVDIVNAMAMEFPKISDDFGDSVINTASMVLGQLSEIWPEKSADQIKAMLGVTPMIGRNYNGQKFELQHARKLVQWANLNKIGLLAFWSIERDNGGCNDIVSPFCSGVSQEYLEFTKIFQGFTG
jgi:hypothetical protein